MKIINEKGKLFGIINVFDLMVLLVIIAGLIFIGSRINFNQSETAIEEQKMEITFLIEEVRFATVEAMTIGDKLYEYDTNLYFGEVVAFEYENHPVFIETDSGELVKVLNDERFDIYVTVESNVVKGPFNVSIATKRVAVGRHLTLLGRYAAVDGVVVKMVEKND
ncbi:MAG: DUF4330 domain-containing protein [Clostridiales bacterium]|nr:DUF4330 domain-containing protein [Clostridiales bacterium]